MPLDVTGPAVGDQAPDFTLDEADGGRVGLADLGGKPIALIFYRGAW